MGAGARCGCWAMRALSWAARPGQPSCATQLHRAACLRPRSPSAASFQRRGSASRLRSCRPPRQQRLIRLPGAQQPAGPRGGPASVWVGRACLSSRQPYLRQRYRESRQCNVAWPRQQAVRASALQRAAVRHTLPSEPHMACPLRVQKRLLGRGRPACSPAGSPIRLGQGMRADRLAAKACRRRLLPLPLVLLERRKLQVQQGTCQRNPK